MQINEHFLPVSPEELDGQPDFVYVNGDAYVDHPSFGAAIISRVLEAHGFTVAMLCQPDWRTTDDFKRFGKPRLGFLVSAGNIDSMVAHYTAAKKRRSEDFYSPGCRAGLRPDRATIVYCNRIREAWGDIPILIGGLEASLRRFAHYDYWQDAVRRSVLVDSRADILMYGMGERSVVRLAELLAKGVPVKKIRDVRGTAYLAKPGDKIAFDCAEGFDEDGQPNGYTYEELKSDKRAYADAFRIQYYNNDAIRGKAIVEYYDEKMLVVNPPQPPLEREELDEVYALPYARTYHPMYEKDGGVPAIKEVRFSITHNRGCFGGCNFCAIAFHQGRAVRSRSIESCVEEGRLLASLPDFKGYIHDVGGPTANFRAPACEKQLKSGVCPGRRCLFPKPCPNLRADHSEYVRLLEELEAIPGVKKVFIRSGIRFDYLLEDPSDEFFRKLVRDHVSGQLKVAPEHCAPNALTRMGKPPVEVYDRFREKFFALSAECGKEQYLVPYLMSSHPGCTMDDAARLAVYLKRSKLSPEQVQDFYPTPGTASTVMYYTGLDPFTAREVYAVTDYREKQLQRALLQWFKPENRRLIREAMAYCTPAGVRDLEELLGGSPGIHDPERVRSAKENDSRGQKKPASDRRDADRSSESGRGRQQKPASDRRDADRSSESGRGRQQKPRDGAAARGKTAPSRGKNAANRSASDGGKNSFDNEKNNRGRGKYAPGIGRNDDKRGKYTPDGGTNGGKNRKKR
ncbi:MAG: YgiQ family radical SAM protein [Clostridia bacterium]|nr:YgiQ family radical SAM protein [Clostridia bacterium]